ncbi:MAG: polysialyltransferase family glycosyltransferase [Winogradskyella sp.]|uniref:polysialyltransferase family glycosyltransferase n=1 Tax=Winogradskyella sp. TaxID=1883156 RepID=UPI003859E390
MESKMKSRLFIVSGPSQLLFLSAALLKNKELETEDFKDVILFKGKDIDSHKRSINLQIAHKVWNWHNILWLKEINFYNNSSQKKSVKKQFDSVDEIWVCMPYGLEELSLSVLFPSAKIVYFDDGLGSYAIPNTLKGYLKKPSFLKKKFSLYFKRTTQALKDVFKDKTFKMPSFSYYQRYMLFSEFSKNEVLPSKRVIVDWYYLKIQLVKCKVDINTHLQLKNKKTCLILGQYFSLFGYINRTQELQHYIKLCKNLESRGYAIIWKEHPKNSKPFYKDLKEEISSIQNLNDYYDDAIPIELIVSNLDVQLYLAATSTSLVILDKVFNYKVCSSAPLLEPYMVGADKFVANLLITKLDEDQLLKHL